MAVKRKRRVQWGSVCAYVFFAMYISMIGVGATFHWRKLDLAYVFVMLGATVVGSAVVLWRAWRHRGEPGGVKLGQFAAMPRSWHKWMLGERDDDDGE